MFKILPIKDNRTVIDNEKQKLCVTKTNKRCLSRQWKDYTCGKAYFPEIKLLDYKNRKKILHRIIHFKERKKITRP